MARSRRGQGLVEYVILLAAGSFVAVATITLAGPQLASLYDRAQQAVANPVALLDSPSPTPTPPMVPLVDVNAPTPAPTAAPVATTAPTAAVTWWGVGDQWQQGGQEGEDQHGHHRD